MQILTEKEKADKDAADLAEREEKESHALCVFAVDRIVKQSLAISACVGAIDQGLPELSVAGHINRTPIGVVLNRVMWMDPPPRVPQGSGKP